MRFRDLKRNIENFHMSSKDDASPSQNTVLLQGFEWYLPSTGSHWRLLQQILPNLKQFGVSDIWLPPGCKAGWQGSNGYDVYDLYDIGEFDQKGSRRTKWGTKEELIDLSKSAQEEGIGLMWDAVLNHKCSADYTERIQAVKVDKEDRRKETSPPHEIEAWTGYNFPGRGDQYSCMKYHWRHFSGTDWEARLKTTDSIYKFVGPDKPGWAKDVDDSLGNYDYLMGNDLDYSQPEVRDDVLNWGEWIIREVGLSGFRLDAVKHFSHSFLEQWMKYLESKFPDRKLFFVGEYWRGELEVLGPVVEKFHGRLSLFDVELAGNMSNLSMAQPNKGDLRGIMKDTLAKHYPDEAVTFVQNHDTQPRYERDHHVTPIEPWFIPLAYAFILLRADSGRPCVFYGDLYGINPTSDNPTPPSCNGTLPKMLLARKLYAYGKMTDYLDQRTCVGFTREGHSAHNNGAGLAVVMSIAQTFSLKKMYVGEQHAGEEWTDILQFAWGKVVIDNKGWGEFPVGPRSVGIWVATEAQGREGLDNFVLEIPQLQTSTRIK